MQRAALLALVVVLSVPAASSAVAAPPSSEAPPDALDRIELLTLGGPVASDFATPSLDVGASVAIQHDAAATRIDQYALDERIRRARNDSVRRGLLFDAVFEAKTRASTLRAEERALRAAYVNGSIDTRAFIRGLALLDARANHLRASVDRIGMHADEVPQFSLDRRLQRIDSRLLGLQGPVRDRALASIRGASSPARIYVEASANGTVLSTIAGDRYVREARRDDERNRETEQLALDQVVDRMRSVYPIAFNESVQWRVGTLSGVYRMAFDLPDGSLISYLDGGSEEVFYEVQDRRLAALAGEETAEASENGTRVVVNRSFPGGPLRIAAYDNATGDPVAATVILRDARLETGDDGVAWTLTPHTERFTVTVVRPTGNVTVTARPIRLPASDSGRD